MKKTYSLNTGTPKGMHILNPSTDLDAPDFQKKPSKTMATRGMSLATKATMDPLKLVADAKDRCKQPIKLSWEDVKFEAEI